MEEGFILVPVLVPHHGVGMVPLERFPLGFEKIVPATKTKCVVGCIVGFPPIMHGDKPHGIQKEEGILPKPRLVVVSDRARLGQYFWRFWPVFRRHASTV